MNTRLNRSVRASIKRGKFEQSIARCESELVKLKETDYHVALGRSWLGQVSEAARWLARFYQTAAKAMTVRAVYCEMNRFEINADEWYIEAFAYDFFGGSDDFDWLVKWKKRSVKRGRFVLQGMGNLQALFARDYSDEPPKTIRAASEVVILLLTLRMQELINAASQQARKSGSFPDDVPVLAAAHDSDLVSCSIGSVMPAVTRLEPARPALHRPQRNGARLGIYKMDWGYDECHNSLPWDVLDFAKDGDQRKYLDRLDKAEPLAKTWAAPLVSIRHRKWRCDIIRLYPHWAVNEAARAVLAPLLGRTVEFLPLKCVAIPQLWVLHPLRHIDLAPDAIHNGEDGRNMSSISSYSFNINVLKRKHLFGIKQAKGSAARKGGCCFAANYVSEEFTSVVSAAGLRGVVFERVFSYREPRGGQG